MTLAAVHTPNSPSDDGPRNPDPFKPAMPRIPGVNDRPPESAEPENAGDVARPNPYTRIAALLLGALVLAALGVWWTHRAARPTVASSGKTPTASLAGLPSSPPNSAESPDGDVASLQELGKPWAAKKFFLRKQFSNETVPAMVIRLPGGAARSGASYWAFSLQAPFGRCELEYLTDLDKLSSQYAYRAHHPMVGDPCSNTLYDPLRLGTLPDGSWARGEVAQGSGIRPPIAVEVHVSGSHLVATKIE